MYYPYFRGRQNELLCLRELLEENKLSKKIVPILEPVKFSSTFFSTLRKFLELNRTIIIVRNPCVGSFIKEYYEMKSKIDNPENNSKKEKLTSNLLSYKEVLMDKHLPSAYILNENVVSNIYNKKIDASSIYLICKERGDCNYFRDHGRELVSKGTFVPPYEDFRDEVEGDLILLENCYSKARRNVDYLEHTDDYFSKNHLVFSRRGYQGFSDYSIVGDEYEESGFAPLAIAIHIIYFDEWKELRVHHFVSDSNENITDPARKFQEAMEKLIKWQEVHNIPMTKGLDSLIKCYYNGKFPGLGVIKKYSIMHHMELMSSYFGDN